MDKDRSYPDAKDGRGLAKSGERHWRFRKMLKRQMMNGGINGLALREASQVRLYRELTGASESTARGVMMYVCFQEGEKASPSAEDIIDRLWRRVLPLDSFVPGRGDVGGWLKRAVVVPATLAGAR
jgi:hypothetical protein